MNYGLLFLGFGLGILFAVWTHSVFVGRFFNRKSKGPYKLNHDSKKAVGKVESISLDKDGIRVKYRY